MENVIICSVILAVNNKTETVFVVVNKRKNEPYSNCWELPSSNFLFSEQVSDFYKKSIKHKFNISLPDNQTNNFYLDVFDGKLYIIYRNKIDYHTAKKDNVKMLPLLQVLNLDMAFNHKRYIRDVLGGF